MLNSYNLTALLQVLDQVVQDAHETEDGTKICLVPPQLIAYVIDQLIELGVEAEVLQGVPNEISKSSVHDLVLSVNKPKH